MLIRWNDKGKRIAVLDNRKEIEVGQVRIRKGVIDGDEAT